MDSDSTVELLAAGDILIERDDPDAMLRHVAGAFQGADIAFANCEQMFTDKGCPNPVHATSRRPQNVAALKRAGLDVACLANNHTLDWGPEGLSDTMERLSQAGIAHVGAGPNVTAAREPVVIEKKGQSVGFLAYGCTGPDGYEAGPKSPGYAPMRAWTVYERIDYQPGTPPFIVTLPHVEDLADMQRDVAALKERCDVVVVSFHWGQHHVPRVIPDYCYTVGRAAIDAGADLILGGHPHILKGIEVYAGKVIFYSLSNFAFEHIPGMARAPRNRPPLRVVLYGDHVDPDPDYPSYPFHRDAKRTLIAKAVISGGAITQVSYLPCYVNPAAEPEIVGPDDPRGQEVFDYVKEISAAVGLTTQFAWQGAEVIITGGGS